MYLTIKNVGTSVRVQSKSCLLPMHTQSHCIYILLYILYILLYYITIYILLSMHTQSHYIYYIYIIIHIYIIILYYYIYIFLPMHTQSHYILRVLLDRLVSITRTIHLSIEGPCIILYKDPRPRVQEDSVCRMMQEQNGSLYSWPKCILRKSHFRYIYI